LQASGFVPTRGIYRVADPFFSFWFPYVFPNRSRLEQGRARNALSAIKADFDNFMGLACREWIRRYAASLPDSAEFGSW
jgi:AAA+ ATPase superfamily predicted ATPase